MKNTFEDTLLAWAIRDTTSGSFARPKFKIKKISLLTIKEEQVIINYIYKYYNNYFISIYILIKIY